MRKVGPPAQATVLKTHPVFHSFFHDQSFSLPANFDGELFVPGVGFAHPDSSRC